jgi:hypothetical protein
MVWSILIWSTFGSGGGLSDYRASAGECHGGFFQDRLGSGQPTGSYQSWRAATAIRPLRTILTERAY